MNYYQNDECASQIRRAMNERIYVRNIPSQTLQPYLDVRPVMTKYSFLPIVDPRTQTQVPMIQQPTFTIEKIFNPGNTTSPWSGFSDKINVESELRNQIFALQKCERSVYVPQSSSDLYELQMPYKATQNLKHELLFKQEQFKSFNPKPENIGNELFMNNTRVQLKNKQFNGC
jgi:hypothetical protein